MYIFMTDLFTRMFTLVVILTVMFYDWLKTQDSNGLFDLSECSYQHTQNGTQK